MKLEKIRFCRCPKCHEHGIPAFKKIGYRYNPKVQCKYCGAKFSVNIALSIMVQMFIPIFWGVIGLLFTNYILKIPFPFWCALAIISLVVFEYFCPMEER